MTNAIIDITLCPRVLPLASHFEHMTCWCYLCLADYVKARHHAQMRKYVTYCNT